MCKLFTQIPIYLHNHCLLFLICCVWIPFTYTLLCFCRCVWAKDILYPFSLSLLIQHPGSIITKSWRICLLNILNVCFCFTIPTPTASLWGKPILWISLVFLQLTPKISVTNNQKIISTLYARHEIQLNREDKNNITSGSSL